MFCSSLLQPSAHGGAKQSCRSCSSPCQSKQRSRTPNPRALHNKVASQLVAQNRRRVSLRPWTTERITIERATLEWITNTDTQKIEMWKFLRTKNSQENVSKERERYGLQSSNWCRPLTDIFQSCIWTSWPRIDSGVHPRGMYGVAYWTECLIQLNVLFNYFRQH